MWFLADLIYLSAAVFLVGMGWRLFVWLRAPAPLKIVLTPAPKTAAGVARRVAGEALLFRSLLRADRRLWSVAWLFHLSLVLLAVGHLGGLVLPEFSRAALRLTEPQFHRLAQLSGGVIGLLALLPLTDLFVRRCTSAQLRYFSTFADYFALVLLLLVVLTGNQMRFLGGVEMSQARQYVGGLLTFRPVAPPATPAFAAHLLLVCALLAYIPFSKLVHLGGVFVSPTLTQRNNPRERRCL